MSASEKAVVRLERDGAVAVIVIDNPPVNAGSWDVRNGIVEAIHTITHDDAIVSVVLIGAGTTFIAGSDIREFGKPLRDPQMPAVIAALETCPKPIVAAIDGASLGGGFEVALGCDARVATRTSVVGLPEVHLGIIPGAGGTQRVPRLTGVARAIELIASGRRVKAPEAKELGLIEAVADGDLRAFAVNYTKSLTAKRRIRDLAVPADSPGAIEQAAQGASGAAKRNPAIAEAIKIVQRAAQTSIDDGLSEERAIFQALRVSETAAALRHLFFAERAAVRLDGAATAESRNIAKVGVVGGGTMGAGIAVCFADAGYPVTLIERDAAAVQSAADRVRATYDRLTSSGRLAAGETQKRLARIVCTSDFAALGDADLAIEAVFENLDVKRDVLARLDAVLKPDAILGSNTSYLDLDMLGAQTRHPDRVVGLHFFAPANVMKLLEVVRTKATSMLTLATAMAVAKKIRKVAVIAGVCEGFIGNRIYGAYRRECEILLEKGAYPEQVDAALESFGFAMGPFAVADLSGLDIAWNTRKRLAATRDPRERYVPILDRLCEMGRLGRKADAGWYTYAPNAKRGTADPLVSELIDAVSKEKGIARRAFTPEQLRERALGAIVNEAALVLQEGIAQRPGDVDLVLVNGYGFPSNRGGPLFWSSRQPRANLNRMIDAVAGDIGFGFRRADIDKALAGI